MKKLLVMMVLLVGLVSGCGKTTTVNDISFNMQFNQLNIDNSTATFTVSGLPNNDEFNQIPEVIVNSLKTQKIKPNTKITVTLQSPELNGKTLSFGTCVYENGQIIDNQIKNVTEEEYNNYIG